MHRDNYTFYFLRASHIDIFVFVAVVVVVVVVAIR